MRIPLVQPNLLDVSDGSHGIIQIQTREHKFAPDAAASGTDPINNPIFGATTYNNGKLVSELNSSADCRTLHH
jgi:hypothetical protein